ncbi:uncharacterized protein LOC131648022 [Vicia villosa]|uniref:uncharacterized protein LOC131648022 n=1 Tax=Vicia villosa TaxID=3911 RepID=UPI00273AB19D|nr:uncharacterized protein LOC131648022 [Vicia villosa]
MDSESEFPVPNRKESERIKEYFQTESQFMADRGYYAPFKNICLRKRAVAVIDMVWRIISSDTYIPYLAMNYFDRLVSRYKGILTDPAVEGRNDAEKLRLFTICCLILAAKMRINNFSVDRFLRALEALKAMKEVITHQMVKKAEYLILDAIHWKLLPVTAFCFLNHYYPYFKEFGGFKRRCINEIIVQAQGEITFVEYTPSQIALSAFLAASKMAYPSKYDKIQNPSNFHKFDNEEEVKKCVNHMIKLCNRLDIDIEPAESGIGSSCSIVVLRPREETKEVGTSKVKEIQQRNSMAVVGDSSNSKAPVVISCEEKEKEDGIAVINGVGTSTVKEIQHGNSKAVVVGSSEEKEKENGTVIINGVGTSKEKEIQQGIGKGLVVGSSEEKEKEDGTVIINGVGTSKVKEIQQGNGKGVVVNFCEEENEDEEVRTALIQRSQVMRNTDPSQVPVLMQVDVIQRPIDDIDRVEAIIRRSLEKRKAVEAEEPQLQMGGSSSDIVDHVEPMNFELKWMAGAKASARP